MFCLVKIVWTPERIADSVSRELRGKFEKKKGPISRLEAVRATHAAFKHAGTLVSDWAWNEESSSKVEESFSHYGYLASVHQKLSLFHRSELSVVEARRVHAIGQQVVRQVHALEDEARQAFLEIEEKDFSEIKRVFGENTRPSRTLPKEALHSLLAYVKFLGILFHVLPEKRVAASEVHSLTAEVIDAEVELAVRMRGGE